MCNFINKNKKYKFTEWKDKDDVLLFVLLTIIQRWRSGFIYILY